jgi:hypothetical protein
MIRKVNELSRKIWMNQQVATHAATPMQPRQHETVNRVGSPVFP